jgi:D-alanine-D-alanine ligase
VVEQLPLKQLVGSPNLPGRTMSRVVILTGGKTSEYTISLLSAREIINNFPKDLEPVPVVIAKNNSSLNSISQEVFISKTKDLVPGNKKEVFFPQAKKINWSNLPELGKMVFIAIHGPFGEDGRVQGLLEILNLPYTGSGPLASGLGANKLLFRKIMIAENISIPKFIPYYPKEKQEKILNRLSLPLFIKPHNQGSSIGVSLVKNQSRLSSAIKKAQQLSKITLIDEAIRGQEVSCGVIGNQKPQPLPVAEIIPKKSFFNYQAKYNQGETKEIIPARLNQDLTKKIQKLAVKIHRILGCRGFSRADFIVNKNQKPVVLEINTIPGLTAQSIFPKEARAAGIGYTNMISQIIKLAKK